jgi:hypothetical protein
MIFTLSTMAIIRFTISTLFNNNNKIIKYYAKKKIIMLKKNDGRINMSWRLHDFYTIRKIDVTKTRDMNVFSNIF